MFCKNHYILFEQVLVGTHTSNMNSWALQLAYCIFIKVFNTAEGWYPLIWDSLLQSMSVKNVPLIFLHRTEPVKASTIIATVLIVISVVVVILIAVLVYWWGRELNCFSEPSSRDPLKDDEFEFREVNDGPHEMTEMVERPSVGPSTVSFSWVLSPN